MSLRFFFVDGMMVANHFAVYRNPLCKDFEGGTPDPDED